MTCIGHRVKQVVIKKCTWKINLRKRETGEGKHFLINGIGWCSIKTVEETIHFAWTLPLTNHHRSIFIENCYFADSSWAVIAPAGCCLLIAPLLPLHSTICWFGGMLSGYRCKQARSSLCTLPFLFFLLPLEITTQLLFIALYYFAVVFIISQGRKSAVTSVSCCINTQDKRQPLALVCGCPFRPSSSE